MADPRDLSAFNDVESAEESFASVTDLKSTKLSACYSDPFGIVVHDAAKIAPDVLSQTGCNPRRARIACGKRSSDKPPVSENAHGYELFSAV